MTTNNPPNPFDLWAKAARTWTESWAGLAGAAPQPGAAPADPFQAWQRGVDQWLAALSSTLEQTFSTPEAAAASGRLLDAWLNIEKPARERTAQAMQAWLEFYNMPTRHDVIRLAGQLNDANARLDELQEQIEALSDQIAALTAGLERPARTPVAAGGEA